MAVVCPVCAELQWSLSDQKYVELFGVCWSEDKRKWENGELSLEEFESRELRASKEE